MLNTMRTDLSFASAGAWFGAMSAKRAQITLDVDSGSRMTFRSSLGFSAMNSYEESQKYWETHELKAMGKWVAIFTPFSSFEYYRTSLQWQSVKGLLGR